MADTDTIQVEVPSTAADDVAREADATPASPTPEAASQPAESSAPAFDRDAWLGQLKGAPEDALDALFGEEPIRKRISAESSRAIQKWQQEAQRERERAETLERQREAQAKLDAAEALVYDSDPDDVDPVELDEARKTVREHRRYQQAQQAAVQDPAVQEWAVRQAGVQIGTQMSAHPELAKVWDAADASTASDYGELAWRLAKTYAAQYLAEREPAIRADERDKRLRGLPNPDLSRSEALPEGERGWTVQRYQRWLRTNEGTPPTPADIDALTASMRRAS